MVTITPAEVALWVGIGCVVYTYLGYPLLLGVLSRVFGREPHPPAADGAELPTVSLLLAAFNEEAVIGERLRNALRSDYPADRLEVLVGSDGSRDGTAAVVRSFAPGGVRLLDFPENRGKAAVLNDLAAAARGDILVLSDANTDFDPGALRCLTRWFADSRVGAVVGRLDLVDPATGRNADGLYWKYETFLKQREARLGALLGANGAIYAIRRDVYPPIPRGTIVDDLVIPLLARLRTGCRVVYDREAVAREDTPARVASEFRRRTRIGAGGLQSLGMLGTLLDPRHGWLSLAFWSHKVLRWLSPYGLLASLAAAWVLADRPLYAALLAAQACFYGVAAAAALAPAGPGFLRPLRLATLFTAMNLALAWGAVRWLTGKQGGAWERTARAPEALEASK